MNTQPTATPPSETRFPGSPETHWPITGRALNAKSSVARNILSYTGRSDMISFAGGLPDPTLFPALNTLQARQELLQYGPSEGEKLLREWIALHLQEKGMEVTADNIIITTGSQQGLDLVSKLLIDPGTPVLTESPTYLTALSAFRLMEARIHGLPLNGERIPADHLCQNIIEHTPAFIYLNPTYQNPSGVCWSDEARDETAQILDRFNTILVEDNPYTELSYGFTKAPQPLCSRLKTADWIYLGSFSKIAMPGLRVGYIACTPRLYKHLLTLKQSVDLHTDRIAQAFTYSFVTNSQFTKHVYKLRHVYSRKRNLMHQCLRVELQNIATWKIPEGGLFFWLKLPEQINARALLEQCLKYGVAFMPGDDFFPEPQPYNNYIRLNFSGITPRDIKYGISILGEQIRQTMA